MRDAVSRSATVHSRTSRMTGGSTSCSMLCTMRRAARGARPLKGCGSVAALAGGVERPDVEAAAASSPTAEASLAASGLSGSSAFILVSQ